jgi:hypothetical protein
VEITGNTIITSDGAGSFTGTPRFDAGGTGGATYFGGYKLIGA